MRVRLGAVSYLNARPLVLGLEQGLGSERLELSNDVPSELAERMLSGEVDIGLLPVVELARMPELELVPGLGIVTRGPSRSVLLVTRGPVEKVESVALDPESRTSNVLAQILLGEVWGCHPEFVVGQTDLEATLGRAGAAVRIGDKALFEPVPGACQVHDLGRVWTDRTGLPFVYAAWAARPGVVDREIYQLLHESRRVGCSAVERIAAAYEWRGARYPELALEYLTRNIVYRLGAPELEGLKHFLQLAEAAKLIDAAPPIRLALKRFTACDAAAARRGPSVEQE